VKIDALVDRLRREAVGNPKKLAILSLLMLVAIYFWSPILWGWVVTEGSNTAKAAVVKTAAASDLGEIEVADNNATEASQATAATDRKVSWEQLVEWMDADPLMEPVGAIALTMSPFRQWQPPAVEESSDEDQLPMPEPIVQQAPVSMSPEALGLSVSATLIGPKRKMARIGGKLFAQDDDIRVSRTGSIIEGDAFGADGGEEESAGAKTEIVYRLSCVGEKEVELTRDGEAFLLKVPGPDCKGRITAIGQ